MSTEKRELELVEKLDFRILKVCNKEDELQKLLKVYLAPLLLKLSSEHASVREKVLKICQYLGTFAQLPGIVLPVAALLDQYKTVPESLSLVKHYDLTFIRHSLGRLSASERRELVPKFLSGISAEADHQAKYLFNILLRLLPDIQIPPRGSRTEESFRQDIGLSDHKDAEFVANWFSTLLLMRTGHLPGIEERERKFLTLNRDDTLDPSSGGLDLPETRIRVANLLASGAFTDEERFFPAIYAAESSDHRLAGLGDDMLKRTTVSLEDASLVRGLFDKLVVVSAPYRRRILGLLCKSELSTTFTADILNAFRQIVPRPAETPEMTSSLPSAMPGERRELGREAARSSKRMPGGLENLKVHLALLDYLNWVARIGPKKPKFDHQFGPALVSELQESLTHQGWPKPDSNHSCLSGNTKFRLRAYELIGLLAQGSCDQGQCIELAEWLFRSLAEDDTLHVVANIDGALSSLVTVFKPPLEEYVVERLRAMLLRYMDQGELETSQSDGENLVVRSTRHAAVKWTNRCLPYTDAIARWIDIKAIGGRERECTDVVEEGRRGLDPWTYYANDGKVSLPDWPELIKTFNIHMSHDSGQEADSDARVSLAHLSAFPVAVHYCKQILLLSALGLTLSPGWETQLETLVQTDKASRVILRDYLSTVDKQHLLDLLTNAFEGMKAKSLTTVEQCAKSFVELASFSPRDVMTTLAPRCSDILPLVTCNNQEIRALGAEAFGILASHPSRSSDAVVESLDALVAVTRRMDTAVGSERNAVEGAFVALGRLVSRLEYYSVGFPASYEKLETLPLLGYVDPSLQEALVEMYSQLWTAGVWNRPSLSDKNFKQLVARSFVDPLMTQAKKGNEKAITALGRLAIALPEAVDEVIGLVLESLYTLYDSKQVEVQFAVGEAITAAVACWDADIVQLTLDVQPKGGGFRRARRTERINEVLTKLLKDIKTTNPSLLKASGIWLFCLIRHCSHVEEVQSQLRECQPAFMRLLSARDEVVQETASRGLCLVYEKGGADLKAALVRDLVSSFTGSGPRLRVDENTELFDPGALPTSEGKSITSYKDIVSLANEVGDQSLVYKFMALATNAATWSTRSAFGRFGLGSILSESEVDPKLYPKLYRYRFDPNVNVQRSMNDIWKALVKPEVVDRYFDDMMKDLLKSILGKEWRVREASCAAIADLIRGRPFQKYERYYSDIWTAALRVLDDVKTSVRNAALRLCLALSNTLVRQLEESGSTSAAASIMKEALPFLLSGKGIESGVEDVKIFATITVIKMAKSGGRQLKPYIATMMLRLLAILSTVEPDVVNYHYLRAGEERRDKIDKLRSSMVSHSPIMDAIEHCLRSVDTDVMKELAPGLGETVKTALGMPTKIGCSRVIGFLATRHANDLKPYATQLLRLVEKQILDRNDEVSQGYARALAYLMRVAPDEATKTVVGRFVDLYLDSDNDTRREKVADVVLALANTSPDQFSALESQLLPFVFLAKHDTNQYVEKALKEVWIKHAGSLTVTRYMAEIVSLVQRCLDATQWALKHAGAMASASAVAEITSGSTISGQVSTENLKAIWPVYEKSLALKTFAGKEELLEAFPDFVRKSKGLWQTDAPFGQLLHQIAIREAKRNNDGYRTHAFRCLWRFASARDDLAMLPEISQIVRPWLDPSEEPDAMEIDTGRPSEARPRELDGKSREIWAAMEAIAKSYNRAKMREEPLAELVRIVDALEKAVSPASISNTPCLSSAQFDIVRRAYWYECVADILEKACKGATDTLSASNLSATLGWYWKTLDIDAAEVVEVGTETQRLARAKAVAVFIELCKKLGHCDEDIQAGLRSAELSIVKAVEVERALEVKRKWQECLNLIWQQGVSQGGAQ